MQKQREGRFLVSRKTHRNAWSDGKTMWLILLHDLLRSLSATLTVAAIKRPPIDPIQGKCQESPWSAVGLRRSRRISSSQVASAARVRCADESSLKRNAQVRLNKPTHKAVTFTLANGCINHTGTSEWLFQRYYRSCFNKNSKHTSALHVHVYLTQSLNVFLVIITPL